MHSAADAAAAVEMDESIDASDAALPPFPLSLVSSPRWSRFLSSQRSTDFSLTFHSLSPSEVANVKRIFPLASLGPFLAPSMAHSLFTARKKNFHVAAAIRLDRIGVQWIVDGRWDGWMDGCSASFLPSLPLSAEQNSRGARRLLTRP